jgi:hypothetical protein
MKPCQRFSAAGILLAAMMFSTSEPVAAQILRIGEMNTQQIRALNLQRTVVLTPGWHSGRTRTPPSFLYRRLCRPGLYRRTGEGDRSQARLDSGPVSADSAGQRSCKHHWRKDGIRGKLHDEKHASEQVFQ